MWVSHPVGNLADHVLILCAFLEIESASVWCWRINQYPVAPVELHLDQESGSKISPKSYTNSFCSQSVTRSDLNMKHCSHDPDSVLHIYFTLDPSVCCISHISQGAQIDIVFLIIITEF